MKHIQIVSLLCKVEKVTFGYPNKRKIVIELFSKQIPK